MSDFITLIVIVIVVGLAVSGGFSLAGVDTPSLLVKDCEKSLPRDQHCKLIAVPDKGE